MLPVATRYLLTGLCALTLTPSAFAQDQEASTTPDSAAKTLQFRSLSLPSLTDSLAYALPEYGYKEPKHPWRAAAETFVLNAGVWAFDRYARDADFAYISFKTVADNFRSGFLWDNDQFITNLFAHPYHGNLYFNTARSNGLSFYQSIPYALVGSLMWELAAENNPPAINDLIATTVGGVALGEVTSRLSRLPLDDRTRGWKRFFREFLSTAISPMRGLNRIISGDAWKVRDERYLYHDYDRLPVALSIGLGSRYLADDNHFFRGEHSPFVNLGLTYGDAFRGDNNAPYDYFTLNLTSNLSPNQPIVSEVNLRGKLWSMPYATTTDIDVVVGLFQHFNYFDSEPIIDGSNATPFKISEAASLGGGAIIRFPASPAWGLGLEQEIYLNGVLLGGSLSDHYNVLERNYNLGSGFSIHSGTNVQVGRRSSLALTIQHLQLFTWRGYTTQALQTVDPLYLNAQGDKGNTRLTTLRSKLSIGLSRGWSVGFDLQYYIRHTHYVEHPDVNYRTFETRLGLYYTL